MILVLHLILALLFTSSAICPFTLQTVEKLSIPSLSTSTICKTSTLEYNSEKITTDYSFINCYSYIWLHDGHDAFIFRYYPRSPMGLLSARRVTRRYNVSSYSSLHFTPIILWGILVFLIILMAGDVELNPGPQSKEESFLNALKSLPSSYKSGLFTSEVIQEKISYILSPRPSLKKEADKWSRIKSKYSIRTYQCSNILYLTETSKHCAK